jgi:hypothetical protein
MICTHEARGAAKPFPSPNMADLTDLDILSDKASKADV